MCITNPLKISDFQGNLLHMLLFSPKHVYDFFDSTNKRGAVTYATAPCYFVMRVPAWLLSWSI